jgi:hypothetical protein
MIMTDAERLALRQGQARRLREAREQAGYREISEAARAAGVPIPSYHAHESGERSLVKNAEVYARTFGVDYRFLLTGDEQSNITSRTSHRVRDSVPVVGVVGDGIWTAAPFAVPEARPVPAQPEFAEHPQKAFRVAVSAAPFARDGTYVVTVPYSAARRGGYRAGDVAVVENRREELVERVIRKVVYRGDAWALEPVNGGPTEPTGDRPLELVTALYRPIG